MLSFSRFRRQQSAHENFGAILFIPQVELKPPLLLAHANVLDMKRKADYPLTRTQIKMFTERTRHSFVLPVRINSTFTIIT